MIMTTLSARFVSVILLVIFFLGREAAYAQTLIPLQTPVKLPSVLIHRPDEPAVSLEMLMKNMGAGGYYILHLWASACRACIPEMKQLDHIHEMLAKQGFTFIFVAEDTNGDFTVPAFLRRHEIKTIQSYVDSQATLLNFLQPRGLPSTYLLTPKGEVIAHYSGSLDWVQMANNTPDSSSPSK